MDNRLKINELIVYFFTCATIGWIMETIYVFVTEGLLMKRGFLYGPICPIYGFGALILILITNISRNKKLNDIQIFIISAVIFTIFEYLVAWILETIFGMTWWDYSNKAFNFQGRICLRALIIWGILGVFFTKRMYDPINKKIKKIQEKIPKNTLKILLIGLIAITITDFVFSIIKYLV